LLRQDNRNPCYRALFPAYFAKIRFLPAFAGANLHDIVKKGAIIAVMGRIRRKIGKMRNFGACKAGVFTFFGAKAPGRNWGKFAQKQAR